MKNLREYSLLLGWLNMTLFGFLNAVSERLRAMKELEGTSFFKKSGYLSAATS